MIGECQLSEILKMRDISKRFPGVLALDNVSLSIERGEVHALLGENGAGKSTLMKILSGAYKKDAGEIIFDGQPVQINSPRQAQELGVSREGSDSLHPEAWLLSKK